MRAPGGSAAAQAAGSQGPGASGEEEGERPAMLMLLAAVALMTGIALRRWSMGPQ